MLMGQKPGAIRKLLYAVESAKPLADGHRALGSLVVEAWERR